ncbi:MAG: hypothetical protein ACLS4Z_08245 [Christensenellaceae bacterium]
MIGYINCDREVTTENYTEYVGFPLTVSGSLIAEYDLSVTAKKADNEF